MASRQLSEQLSILERIANAEGEADVSSIVSVIQGAIAANEVNVLAEICRNHAREALQRIRTAKQGSN